MTLSLIKIYYLFIISLEMNFSVIWYENILSMQCKVIWIPPILSELNPIIFDMELTY